jgi:hypothetical protein
MKKPAIRTAPACADEYTCAASPFFMPITPSEICIRLQGELDGLSDDRVQAHIRRLLVDPVLVHRNWDYGTKGQTSPCWTVLPHASSDTAIVFCEFGFGPGSPWGLVSDSGSPYLSMGMDSAWFTKFVEAYFESFAATELPIWRVFKQDDDIYPGVPLTDEADWKSTWAEVERLRKSNSLALYNCDHSIKF